MMVNMATTVLDRELYDESLAAEVLGINQRTLHYWLEGGTYRDKTYAPIIRREATSSHTVTWGEFVEARYLREYRRSLNARMPDLRAFITYLRDELGVPYPLAHSRPWVGPGRRLLIAAQEEAGLPPELWTCVEPQTGVTLLLPAAESFLERVVFEGGDEHGYVVRLHPRGLDSPIVIDPDVRFGTPVVAGIPTGSLAEQVEAGDSIESVARDFDLDLADVIEALSYEGLERDQAA
ncbi:MAG TPA: DUF433 domain-containing protein [Acidimicrobiales bacterium]|nr:DUF433 domain-containing protein [Acidimicrobiales bacterium]